MTYRATPSVGASWDVVIPLHARRPHIVAMVVALLALAGCAVAYLHVLRIRCERPEGYSSRGSCSMERFRNFKYERVHDTFWELAVVEIDPNTIDARDASLAYALGNFDHVGFLYLPRIWNTGTLQRLRGDLERSYRGHLFDSENEDMRFPALRTSAFLVTRQSMYVLCICAALAMAMVAFVSVRMRPRTRVRIDAQRSELRWGEGTDAARPLSAILELEVDQDSRPTLMVVTSAGRVPIAVGPFDQLVIARDALSERLTHAA